MALIVEEDKPSDPSDIGLLGFVAVVASADGLPDPIKELRLLPFGGMCDPDDLQGWPMRIVGRCSGSLDNGFLDHRLYLQELRGENLRRAERQTTKPSCSSESVLRMGSMEY
jgi:hypothetical protein